MTKSNTQRYGVYTAHKRKYCLGEYDTYEEAEDRANELIAPTIILPIEPETEATNVLTLKPTEDPLAGISEREADLARLMCKLPELGSEEDLNGLTPTEKHTLFLKFTGVLRKHKITDDHMPTLKENEISMLNSLIDYFMMDDLSGIVEIKATDAFAPKSK